MTRIADARIIGGITTVSLGLGDVAPIAAVLSTGAGCSKRASATLMSSDGISCPAGQVRMPDIDVSAHTSRPPGMQQAR